MNKQITQEKLNALIFCMAQRAAQENKINECLDVLEKVQKKLKEGDYNAGRI